MMATDPVSEVEKRAEEANKTERGADHQAIIRDVADEYGITVEALKAQCRTKWTSGMV